MDYTGWNADDLLEALELSGRKPDPELLRACLAHREEITPTLLEWLREGIDETWTDSDPRGYREIHAGLMLIEFGEEEALPIFDAIYRDPMREDPLNEWFNSQYPKYGAKAIPWLIRLAQDPNAVHWSRYSAVSMLGKIAELFPEEHAHIVDALISFFPSLRDDGALDLATEPEDVDDVQAALWTWAICELMDLREAKGRPQVQALYEADLVDESIVGGWDSYLAAIEGRDDAYRGVDPVDLVAFYDRLRGIDESSKPEFTELDMRAVAGLGQLIGQIKAETDMGDEGVADLLLSLVEEMEREELEDEPVKWSAPPPLAVYTEKHPGRNEPCSCGSGKKYKHCCGKAH